MSCKANLHTVDYMPLPYWHTWKRDIRITNHANSVWQTQCIGSERTLRNSSYVFYLIAYPVRHLYVLIPNCFTDNNWCLIRPNRNHKYCPTDGHSARHVRKSELKWREIEEKCQFDVCLFFFNISGWSSSLRREPVASPGGGYRYRSQQTTQWFIFTGPRSVKGTVIWHSLFTLLHTIVNKS